MGDRTRYPAMPIADTRQQEGANPLVKFDRIYNLYRTCVLNELYYGCRLDSSTRTGFWFEVIIVVGSGTSGVAGWIIWTKYPAMSVLWGVIAAASTLLAALKPVMQNDGKMRRYSTLHSAYRQLAITMKEIVDEIAEVNGISPDMEREIGRMRTRYRALSSDDDPRPSRKLVERLQAEVNQQVPTSSFFYPTGNYCPPRPSNIAESVPPAVVSNAEGVASRINPIDAWPPGKERGR
jgi:hypothetical protein